MVKKREWRGLIFHNCEILDPIIIDKSSSKDHWNIKCFCGKIFKAKPDNLQSGNTKSCSCLNSKLSSERAKIKKYNYYNFVNKFGIKLIRPLKENFEGPLDQWIALCPRHNPPSEFITIPNRITDSNSKIQSCGCLHFELRSKKAIEINKQKRISKGLNEDEYLTKLISLLRNKLFNPIKPLVLKLDSYTCMLCLEQKKYLEVHHIDPINTIIDFDKKENYYKIYNINNLVTLCKKCHSIAHDGHWIYLNKNIQQELFIITSLRPLPQKIKNEYIKIIDNIEIWLLQYIQNKV